MRLIFNSTFQRVELLARLTRSFISFECYIIWNLEIALQYAQPSEQIHENSRENRMTCMCDLVQGRCGYNVDGDLLYCGNPSKPMRATTPHCDLGHAIAHTIFFQSHGDASSSTLAAFWGNCLFQCGLVCQLPGTLWAWPNNGSPCF